MAATVALLVSWRFFSRKARQSVTFTAKLPMGTSLPPTAVAGDREASDAKAAPTQQPSLYDTGSAHDHCEFSIISIESSEITKKVESPVQDDPSFRLEGSEEEAAANSNS